MITFRFLAKCNRQTQDVDVFPAPRTPAPTFSSTIISGLVPLDNTKTQLTMLDNSLMACIHPVESYFLLQCCDACQHLIPEADQIYISESSAPLLDQGGGLPSRAVTFRGLLAVNNSFHQKLTVCLYTLEEENVLILGEQRYESEQQLAPSASVLGASVIEHSLLQGEQSPTAVEETVDEEGIAELPNHVTLTSSSQREKSLQHLTQIHWIVRSAHVLLEGVYATDYRMIGPGISKFSDTHGAVVREMVIVRDALMAKKEEIQCVLHDMCLLYDLSVNCRRQHEQITKLMQLYKSSYGTCEAFLADNVFAKVSSSTLHCSVAPTVAKPHLPENKPAEIQSRINGRLRQSKNGYKTNPLRLIMQNVFPVTELSKK